MLLLLKGAQSGIAAATLGIGFGLSGIAGTTASLGVVIGLTPPEAVEANIFVTPDIHFGLSAISTGFLTRTASLSTTLDLAPRGGFGASPTLGILMGLSGTVGTFLQSTAIPGITMGLTASLASPATASLSTVFTIAGSPTISGGTVSTAATHTIQMSLNGAPIFVGRASLDMDLNLTGIGTLAIPFENQARTMRLTFECDQIRTFFRRG
jgi:hypothetical protein